MTRVNIWMDEELHKKLKVICTIKEITIQDYIEQSVKNKVGEDLDLVEDLLK